MRRWLTLATCLLAGNSILAPLVSAGPAPLDAVVAAGERLAREPLAPTDGWAAFSTGTSGGSAAAPENVYVVTTRKELVDALKNAGALPKIILVSGTIDANVDNDNAPLACADYVAPGYTLEAYLSAFDPKVWGRKKVSGPLENARLASQKNQQNRVRVAVTANTTIVGLGDDATIVGANMYIKGVDNVIIRNITFRDAFDCFPQWDPTDGSAGNWNSQYDNIWVTGSTHVWIDHCAFDDGANPESAQPVYFGRVYTPHDGQLDITNASDLVTASWNRFTGHDKVMLIGSSDNAPLDVGKLRVTLHHNLYANVVQRGPRVRYGQVHIYNDFYVIGDDDGYDYSWGVGVESHIYAENNFFEMGSVTPDQIIKRYSGTAIHVGETCVNGPSGADRIDVLAAYNATYDPDLVPDDTWAPVLVGEMHPTGAVPALVWHKAGPFGAKSDHHVPR